MCKVKKRTHIPTEMCVNKYKYFSHLSELLEHSCLNQIEINDVCTKSKRILFNWFKMVQHDLLCLKMVLHNLGYL